MITLFQLMEWARDDFPGRQMDIGLMFRAWANHDETEELARLIESVGMDSETWKNALASVTSGPTETENGLLQELLLQNAKAPVAAVHLLERICSLPDSRFHQPLKSAGLDIRALLVCIKDLQPPRGGRLANAGIEVSPQANPILQYGRDLTADASRGLYENLCDRPSEMERLYEVMLCRLKGSAALTGPAGVGKTAIVERFARSIVRREAPRELHGTRVFELSMGQMVAGTQYRGMFEERMQTVIATLQKMQPAILFVDEMHLLWGAGRAEGVIMDAGNILKPALARNAFRMIGATTDEEYQRDILRDRALARRFQRVRIAEPNDALTEKMVLAQATELGRHHRIRIPRSIIRAAIELTNQHVINRYQPDKSVSLLDRVCVCVKRDGRHEIAIDDLLHVLADQTGMSISALSGRDRQTLRNLSSAMKAAIIGQDAAIDTVTQLLIHRRQGFGNRECNLATFLFCGETGIGKTETARKLAELFYHV